MIAVGVLVVLGVVVIAGGSLLSKAVTSSNNFNRVLIWKASLAAVRQSPLLGWGLGSYPDVYAINQPKEIILPNDKAHSTPIEVLVEMGIPGGIAAMLIVLIPWWTAFRATLRRRRQRYLTAAAFAVVTVPILHSMIDFSLQIPAIAFMSSAFLGLGWAHAFSRDQQGHLAFTGDP
jgi:O-antigen ligase